MGVAEVPDIADGVRNGPPRGQARLRIAPSLGEAQAIAREQGVSRVPLAAELLSDAYTPLGVLSKLKAVSRHCFVLESVAGGEKRGRYTFLGFEPRMAIACKDGVMVVDGQAHATSDPASELRAIMHAYRTARVEGLPPFAGGLVGYFGYDYLKYAEPTLRLDARDTENFQDFDLMLFDRLICFDDVRQKIILIAHADLSCGDSGYAEAQDALVEMARIIQDGASATETPGHVLGPAKALFDEESYCDMVRRAQRYIREGDIFQVVLSNRLEVPYEGSLLNAYRVLRAINPSPYMFYFSGSDMEVAGASPETLVKLEDGVLHTFPLAGTRPRGKTPQEDRMLEEELLADEKELAEHNMLVDLGRNDLGKVSEFGSVEVERLHSIERYSHVMHIGSVVRGRLREGCDALDAIEAVLPAGTLSGAPKIRAAQIINELEDNKRGIYGGALGYLDFAGNMDVCIAIRIAYKKNGRVFVRSGAGIVADSDPVKEYRECVNKAAAVVRALEDAEELR